VNVRFPRRIQPVKAVLAGIAQRTPCYACLALCAKRKSRLQHGKIAPMWHDARTLEPTGFHEREHLDGRIARTFGDLFFAGAF
jgi:hypothetical protein